jgi:hypothetical protein
MLLYQPRFRHPDRAVRLRIWPKLKARLLPAVNQSEYMQAAAGDQADLRRE